MANAKKCDCCGAYFELSQNSDPTGISFYRESRRDGSKTWDYGTTDLCPRCTKSLESFIKGGCTLKTSPNREAVIKAYKELLTGSDGCVDTALGYLGEALDN